MSKLIQKIKSIDSMSWLRALAVVLLICSVEICLANTGTHTLTQGIKKWVDIGTEAAYWISIGVTIVAFVIMLVTKNWSVMYWVVGAAIVAYLISNIQQFFSDGGVTGALF